MRSASTTTARTASRAETGELENWLRSLGVKAALAMDWDTSRVAPAFIDESALADQLSAFGRGAAAFEFGHGDGNSCLFRARLGLANYGIGDCRLLLTVAAVARTCLAVAYPEADRRDLDLAARAISGELLAPHFDDLCPKPGEWDSDGVSLACYVVECLAETPELVVPDSRDYAAANSDGTISSVTSSLAALGPGSKPWYRPSVATSRNAPPPPRLSRWRISVSRLSSSVRSRLTANSRWSKTSAAWPTPGRTSLWRRLARLRGASCGAASSARMR
jgi:hypothetical protein